MWSKALGGGVLALAALGSACSGTSPAATPTQAGATSGATATNGSVATSPPAVTNPPAAELCAAFPTIDPANPAMPSFQPDPQLEAHFPAAIDGNPVTEVQSGSFAQYACLTGSAALQGLQNTAQYNLLTLTWGSANATVAGETTELFAFRDPGGDATQIVQTLAQLAAVSGGDADVGEVEPGTAGGKNVLIATNEDGNETFAYLSGDTLITVSEVTQAQADKIFTAIN